jgi:dCTP deaminase
VIDPFRMDCLGTNSYDVHLGKWLALYDEAVLDAKKHNTITHFEIPEEGYVLIPGKLYLGATEEYTETHNAVPFLEGKSSTGRLGIDIHATAGKGDVGFCNHWTLEISVAMPVRVYVGMPIGQLIYFQVEGEINNFYNRKPNAKYNQRTDKPVESMMWKNQF